MVGDEPSLRVFMPRLIAASPLTSVAGSHFASNNPSFAIVAIDLAVVDLAEARPSLTLRSLAPRVRSGTGRSRRNQTGGRNVSTGRVLGSEPRRGDGAGLSAAALFTLLWEGLADVLGTAATAVLVRRAARRAAPRSPELAELAISRENLEYRFTLPRAWTERADAATAAAAADAHALRELVGELRPLLVELTGPVVVRRLAQIPELRERGIIPSDQEPS
jgi:hypothetical protein